MASTELAQALARARRRSDRFDADALAGGADSGAETQSRPSTIYSESEVESSAAPTDDEGADSAPAPEGPANEPLGRDGAPLQRAGAQGEGDDGEEEAQTSKGASAELADKLATRRRSSITGETYQRVKVFGAPEEIQQANAPPPRARGDAHSHGAAAHVDGDGGGGATGTPAAADPASATNANMTEGDASDASGSARGADPVATAGNHGGPAPVPQSVGPADRGEGSDRAPLEPSGAATLDDATCNVVDSSESAGEPDGGAAAVGDAGGGEATVPPGGAEDGSAGAGRATRRAAPRVDTLDLRREITSLETAYALRAGEERTLSRALSHFQRAYPDWQCFQGSTRHLLLVREWLGIDVEQSGRVTRAQFLRKAERDTEEGRGAPPSEHAASVLFELMDRESKGYIDAFDLLYMEAVEHDPSLRFRGYFRRQLALRVCGAPTDDEPTPPPCRVSRPPQ